MKQIWRVTALGVVLTGLLGVTPAIEAEHNHSKTYLTFNGSVALPGVTLPAGTYIFELPVFETPSIVRVWNRDRTRLVLTAFTNVVERPKGIGSNEQVTFGEAMRDGARRISRWYPVEMETGREFLYR